MWGRMMGAQYLLVSGVLLLLRMHGTANDRFAWCAAAREIVFEGILYHV